MVPGAKGALAYCVLKLGFDSALARPVNGRMQPKSPRWRDRLRKAALGCAVAALALACHWPALRGSQVWDDPSHLTRPALRSLAGLGRICFDLRATEHFNSALN
jgi:hypothetical protein